jgi:hypothetical protein
MGDASGSLLQAMRFTPSARIMTLMTARLLCCMRRLNDSEMYVKQQMLKIIDKTCDIDVVICRDSSDSRDSIIDSQMTTSDPNNALSDSS